MPSLPLDEGLSLGLKQLFHILSWEPIFLELRRTLGWRCRCQKWKRVLELQLHNFPSLLLAKDNLAAWQAYLLHVVAHTYTTSEPIEHLQKVKSTFCI
jgi:hypothetical protein